MENNVQNNLVEIKSDFFSFFNENIYFQIAIIIIGFCLNTFKSLKMNERTNKLQIKDFKFLFVFYETKTQDILLKLLFNTVLKLTPIWVFIRIFISITKITKGIFFIINLILNILIIIILIVYVIYYKIPNKLKFCLKFIFWGFFSNLLCDILFLSLYKFINHENRLIFMMKRN